MLPTNCLSLIWIFWHLITFFLNIAWAWNFNCKKYWTWLQKVFYHIVLLSGSQQPLGKYQLLCGEVSISITTLYHYTHRGYKKGYYPYYVPLPHYGCFWGFLSKKYLRQMSILSTKAGVQNQKKLTLFSYQLLELT